MVNFVIIENSHTFRGNYNTQSIKGGGLQCILILYNFENYLCYKTYMVVFYYDNLLLQ